MTLKRSLTVTAWIAALITMASHANAQTLPLDTRISIGRTDAKAVSSIVPVSQPSFARIAESLNKPPMTLSSFKLRPALMIQTQYNDNIYFDNDNERDDIIIRTQPSLNIQKDYRDHEWQLNLSTEDTRYLDNTQESAQTYAIDTHLKIAATNNIKLLFTGETAKNILARSTPGSTRFTDKPTSFNVSSASAGASYRFSRFNLTLVGEHERRSYKDGVSSTSSNPVIFSTSNHKTSSATATLHYNLWQSPNSTRSHSVFRFPHGAANLITYTTRPRIQKHLNNATITGSPFLVVLTRAIKISSLAVSAFAILKTNMIAPTPVTLKSLISIAISIFSSHKN